MNSNRKNIVGYLKSDIIKLLNLEISPGEIKLFYGGIKHIKNRRLDCFKNYKDKIPEIIRTPDYVGTHPKYLNSVEYIKKMNTNILVAVRSDEFRGLYVATMYDITDSKIIKMLKYGRIKKADKG